EVFEDKRGYFCETYKQSDFLKNDIKENFVQDNQSYSKKNVLRGLHYQLPPYQQGKLVRCINGEIFDVAVDIRENSDTFKKWVGVNLSSENKKIIYIPPGFAHGFYTLSKTATIHYKVTEEYAPEYDSAICWNDSDINIEWPDGEKIVSKKDKNAKSLKEAELL
ncbi:MAG: dTDP-4-dehydrorhamnose 3,5-epimerase, partial [Candidatus Mcinerneyibacterium aminivorans]